MPILQLGNSESLFFILDRKETREANKPGGYTITKVIKDKGLLSATEIIIQVTNIWERSFLVFVSLWWYIAKKVFLLFTYNWTHLSPIFMGLLQSVRCCMNSEFSFLLQSVCNLVAHIGFTARGGGKGGVGNFCSTPHSLHRTVFPPVD